jgi:hypothetical protein
MLDNYILQLEARLKALEEAKKYKIELTSL